MIRFFFNLQMSYIVIPDFLIHSSSANFYLTYHLALITQSEKKFKVSSVDDRFVDTDKIDLTIHYGPVVAVKYKCEPGNGHRMPRIEFAPSV